LRRARGKPGVVAAERREDSAARRREASRDRDWRNQADSLSRVSWGTSIDGKLCRVRVFTFLGEVGRRRSPIRVTLAGFFKLSREKERELADGATTVFFFFFFFFFELFLEE
jgi:hypothetical protein